MKGFGHITWGASAYVIAISLLTILLLPITRVEFMIGAISLAVLAIIVQHFEAIADKGYKETKDGLKKAVFKKTYKILRMVIVTMLTFAILLLMGFHIGLMYNGLENFHFGLIFSGYFLAIFGSMIPDLDTGIFGIGSHRDPTTHSALIGSVMAFSLIFFLEGDFLIICFMSFSICIGMMMHLFCDIVPEGSNGIKALISLFRWKESPGDIRGIREDREQPYLVTNGLILGFFAIVSIVRSLTERVAFPAVWGVNGANFTDISAILFVVSVLLLIAPLIMRVLFSDKKKKSTKKRTASPKKKALPKK